MPDYPDNWNEIREKVLRRDNYRCCNEPSHNKKLHIHHIVPLSKGGTHNLNNLITLCEDCHKRIHPHLEVNFKGDRKEGEERIICDSDILEIDISTDFEIRDIALNNLISRIEESTIDVREKLQNYNGEVDEFQKKVVEAEESVIRVLAPAGSGKTQTIINRVISNIRRGLNPNNILVLTFDNSAVNSLQEKLSGVLSNLVINFQLEIKTLNAFGFSLLDYYFPEEHKNIIPDFRQKKLFEEVKKGLHEISQEIYSALPRSIYYSYYIELFSLLKNEIIDPRDPENQKIVDIMLSRNEFIPLFPNPDDRNIVRKTIQAVIWLYQAYDKVMQNENLMDFDDQKLRSYILLCQNIEILNNVQSKYKEIIVDEFQDINQLDFKFIKLISNQSRLVITGDDDQAIYGFRGCSPKFILELQNMLGRQVTTYRLQKNYRSPQNIVMYSTNLIRHNTRREEKDPIPAKTGVAEIKIVSSISSGLEAKLIVGYLKRVKRENQISYKDCVVLYRTNAQSLTLQVEFILNNIPYYVREEDNILGNETLEKLLGFLRMKLAIK
jgi:DNA helicase-2/ATP-dependent DNA helicase PcrA